MNWNLVRKGAVVLIFLSLLLFGGGRSIWHAGQAFLDYRMVVDEMESNYQEKEGIEQAIQESLDRMDQESRFAFGNSQRKEVIEAVCGMEGTTVTGFSAYRSDWKGKETVLAKVGSKEDAIQLPESANIIEFTLQAEQIVEVIKQVEGLPYRFESILVVGANNTIRIRAAFLEGGGE